MLRLTVALAALAALALLTPTGAATAEWKKLRTRGDKLFRKGDFGGATTAYTTAINSVDDASSADGKAALKRLYLQRAKARAKRGRKSAAVSDLGHAVDADPGFAAARLMRAQINLEQGECTAAREDYEEVLKADPRKRDAQKRLPDARECEQALRAAEEARQRQDWAAVERYVDDATMAGRATRAPQVLLLRAEARIRLQKFPEASADSLAAIKLDKSLAEAEGAEEEPARERARSAKPNSISSSSPARRHSRRSVSGGTRYSSQSTSDSVAVLRVKR